MYNPNSPSALPRLAESCTVTAVERDLQTVVGSLHHGEGNVAENGGGEESEFSGELHV